MQGKIKSALLTTAIVLGTIYALRQISVTKSFVDKALAG